MKKQGYYILPDERIVDNWFGLTEVVNKLYIPCNYSEYKDDSHSIIDFYI